MFISSKLPFSEIWYDNLWYFQNLPVELRSFRTLLPVFFRQPHHLVNSSAETHGNSTTSASTSPTSSPTKKNIHQPSPIKHGFPIPFPNPKPQQQIPNHSKVQPPAAQRLRVRHGLRVAAPLHDSSKLRLALGHGHHESNGGTGGAAGFCHEGDGPVGLMGSDLGPKGWFHIVWNEEHVFEAYFFFIFFLVILFWSPLDPNKNHYDKNRSSVLFQNSGVCHVLELDDPNLGLNTIHSWQWWIASRKTCGLWHMPLARAIEQDVLQVSGRPSKDGDIIGKFYLLLDRKKCHKLRTVKLYTLLIYSSTYFTYPFI